MSRDELFERLGPAWQSLSVYDIDGIPHWAGCKVMGILGIKNITNAIKGTPRSRKLSFPAYRMHMERDINPRRSVYMLAFNGVIQAIRRNSSTRCRELQAILDQLGM